MVKYVLRAKHLYHPDPLVKVYLYLRLIRRALLDHIYRDLLTNNSRTNLYLFLLDQLDIQSL